MFGDAETRHCDFDAVGVEDDVAACRPAGRDDAAVGGPAAAGGPA
jgi:hypothetical protein